MIIACFYDEIDFSDEVILHLGIVRDNTAVVHEVFCILKGLMIIIMSINTILREI